MTIWYTIFSVKNGGDVVLAYTERQKGDSGNVLVQQYGVIGSGVFIEQYDSTQTGEFECSPEVFDGIVEIDETGDVRSQLARKFLAYLM